jgi:hypothetical protein
VIPEVLDLLQGIQSIAILLTIKKKHHRNYHHPRYETPSWLHAMYQQVSSLDESIILLTSGLLSSMLSPPLDARKFSDDRIKSPKLLSPAKQLQQEKASLHPAAALQEGINDDLSAIRHLPQGEIQLIFMTQQVLFTKVHINHKNEC